LLTKYQKSNNKGQFEMKNAARLALTTACLLSFSILGVGQTQKKPKTHQLFVVSKAFIAQVKPICKTDTCQDLIRQVSALVADAEQKYTTGTLSDEDRMTFHQEFGDRILKIQNELQKLLNVPANDGQTQPNPTSLHPLHAPAAVSLAAFQADDLCAGCDRALNQALAICGLYVAAGPAGVIAAAICVAATVYAYNDCLNRNGCLGGGGSPAPLQCMLKGNNEEIYGMDAA
jgi:hypothetical protein